VASRLGHDKDDYRHEVWEQFKWYMCYFKYYLFMILKKIKNYVESKLMSIGITINKLDNI
jgi:hypothetical protein